jgi:hypothetical protein
MHDDNHRPFLPLRTAVVLLAAMMIGSIVAGSLALGVGQSGRGSLAAGVVTTLVVIAPINRFIDPPDAHCGCGDR